MIAFPITSSSPSQLSKIIHPRCRLAVKEKSASSSDESPRGSEVSRLPNSIQVCTGVETIKHGFTGDRYRGQFLF